MTKVNYLQERKELKEFLLRKASERNPKSFFKSCKNWATSHLYEILIFIFMIGCFLAIIWIGNNIIKNIIDLFVGFAAIFTTFFMYLTAKETKKSNDLRIADVEYDRFQKRIDELEAKYKIFDLISDDDVKFINSEFGIFPMKNPKIKYTRFPLVLTELKELIEKHPDYIKCKELLNKEISVVLVDSLLIQNVPKLTKALEILESSLVWIEVSSLELLLLFNEIKYSTLFEAQRKVLVLKLWSFTNEFSFVYDSYIKKDYFYKSVLLFQILKIQESNLLVQTNVDFTSIIVMSRVPYEMFVKYLPSSFSM